MHTFQNHIVIGSAHIEIGHQDRVYADVLLHAELFTLCFSPRRDGDTGVSPLSCTLYCDEGHAANTEFKLLCENHGYDFDAAASYISARAGVEKLFHFLEHARANA